MADGFLGRWSRRKLEVKEGKAVEAEPPLPAPEVIAPAPPSVSVIDAPVTALDDLASAPGDAPGEGGAEGKPELPPLTLEDVKALTSESDFARFVTSDVAPDVKNAAMKKLFSDPRYNVMDGMDIYIDDYSKPDPIPAAMLRQLVSAKFLGLFDDEEEKERQALAAQARDVADNPTAQSVAQSEPPPLLPEPAPSVAEPTDHADADLRLQQDDAPPGEDPGRRTE